MKLKKGLIVRKIANEYMLIRTGKNANAKEMIMLNKVSAFILSEMKKDTDKDKLLKAVLDKYEIDEATAEKDLDKIIAQLNELGLVE